MSETEATVAEHQPTIFLKVLSKNSVQASEPVTTAHFRCISRARRIALTGIGRQWIKVQFVATVTVTLITQI